MNVEMITTTFPKFPGDSHGPWILTIAKDLVSMNNAVRVVAPGASDLANKKENFSGVEVVRFRYMLKQLEQVAYGANIPSNLKNNKIARLVFPFFVVGFFIATAKHLFKGDVIHAQFGYTGVFVIAAKLLFRKKTPVIISFYGRDVAHATKHKKIYDLAFKHADKILVLSNDMRANLVGIGCAPEKIMVHHLGVDLKHFMPRQVAVEKNMVRFLVVANFVEKKGIDLAIDAFKKLIDANLTGMTITLTLVGRGPEEAKYREQINRYALGEKVFIINNYLAQNPRQVVLNEMQQSDIFLLPSVSVSKDYGGTPIVLMEAGAVGLPVITTDDAGNAEIVIDQQTGIIVQPNNVEQLFMAMEKLLLNPDIRKSYGKNARHHIATEYNQQLQMDKLKNIYNAVSPI